MMGLSKQDKRTIDYLNLKTKEGELFSRDECMALVHEYCVENKKSMRNVPNRYLLTRILNMSDSYIIHSTTHDGKKTWKRI